MYSLSFIKKSLKLLDRHDGKITKTARELGIKVRTLTDWKEKRDKGKPLLVLPYKRYSRSKYSREQKKIAIAYYFEHSQNISMRRKKLGFPKYSTLKDWLYKNKKYQRPKRINPPKLKEKYTTTKAIKKDKFK